MITITRCFYLGVTLRIGALSVAIAAQLILVCAADGSPFLIASDYFGQLRRVNPATGAILGTLSGGRDSAEIDYGPDGLLYTSHENSQIEKVNPVTGLSAGFISLPGHPRDVTFGPDHQLYVALIGDTSGHGVTGIYRYNLQSQQLSKFNTSTLNGSPIGIAFGPENDIWVCLDTRFAGSGSPSVIRIDGQSGATESVFTNEHVDIPQSLAFGLDGTLYVGNQGSHNITEYSASGAYLGILVPSAGNTQGLYILPDGDLVFGRGGSFFSRVDLPSKSISVFSSGYGFSMGMVLVPEPSSIAITAMGVLAIAIWRSRYSSHSQT